MVYMVRLFQVIFYYMLCYAVLENIRSGASWRNYEYFSLILYGNNGAFSLNDSVSITRVDTNETITGTFTSRE